MAVTVKLMEKQLSFHPYVTMFTFGTSGLTSYMRNTGIIHKELAGHRATHEAGYKKVKPTEMTED